MACLRSPGRLEALAPEPDSTLPQTFHTYIFHLDRYLKLEALADRKAPEQASALPHTFHISYLRLEALADRKALAPEQASVLRMLAWCRDFALLQLYEQVRASPHL